MKPEVPASRNELRHWVGWSAALLATAMVGFLGGWMQSGRKTSVTPTCVSSIAPPTSSVTDSPPLDHADNMKLSVSSPSTPVPAAPSSAATPTASLVSPSGSTAASPPVAYGINGSVPSRPVAWGPASSRVVRAEPLRTIANEFIPGRPAGNERGIPIPRVPRGSLLELLGLQTGDQLLRVNGFDVRSPEQALQAYAYLRRADRLVVEIRRKDQIVEFVYRII